jgi:hypothetical protein
MRTPGILWTYEPGTFDDTRCRFLHLVGAQKPYRLRVASARG